MIALGWIPHYWNYRMSASACLRIVLDLSDEKLAKLEGIGHLVSKVTGAFLETRWSWPKRFDVLTPFSFMLTDPKATEVDTTRLEQLAEELQRKLFGASGAGRRACPTCSASPLYGETRSIQAP